MEGGGRVEIQETIPEGGGGDGGRRTPSRPETGETRRPVPQRRQGVPAQRRAGVGERPRLPRQGPRQGHPVPGLRPGRQRRLGQRRHRSRHLRVRRADHTQLVAASRAGRPPQRHPAADQRRRWRLQRYRVRLWKTELANLASEIGLHITVCHLPPGTSKWNKIEHLLFSHIQTNLRGRPLISHEVIVNLIGNTTTRSGLTVHAELDDSAYPSGIKITDQQMRELG